MEKLLIIDPYNKKHKEKVKEYEQEQGLGKSISSLLDNISSNSQQDEYQNRQRQSNIVETYLAIKDGESINGLYLVHEEKDRKACQLSIIGKPKKKKSIISITTYLFEHFKMVEVFIKINTSEAEAIKYLKLQGYEDLGEENGDIIFLKENEKGTTKETNYETTR